MAATMNRAVLDIAKLDENGTAQAEDVAGTKPIENEQAHRMAEFAVAFSGSAFIVCIFVPYEWKQGQMWYTILHALILGWQSCFSWLLFRGNTHVKLLRFLTGKKIFVQVVVLSLIDWLRVMIMPYPGE